MPYPNFHACRLKEPALFKKETFKTLRTKTKGLTFIIGILKSTGKSAVQAFRYDKTAWQAEKARKHCNARGGKFEAASVKKNQEFLADHSFMHLIWKKVQDGEWNGWSRDDVLSEHSKVADGLRRMGYAMTPRTSLDEESKKNEETVRKMSPSDIPTFLGAEKKRCDLADRDFFSDLSLFDEIDSKLNFISLLESDDKIVLMIKKAEKDPALEEKILSQFPEEIQSRIHFVYDEKGPDSTHVPLFDLVLKPKALEIFFLDEEKV